MLSNALELTGLVAFVLGIYELSGRGWGLLALAVCLLFLGVAADGVNPVRAGLTDVKRRAQERKAKH